MKKTTITISIILLALIGGYVMYQKFFSSPANPSPISNTTGDGQTSAPHESINLGSIGSDNNPTSNTTGNSGGIAQAGTYKDGQYTGNVANAVYGPIQVKVIVSQGKITDIQMLQYPNSPGHTTEVSSQSLPILKTEAIQAQSANVQIVSGATQTSEGFIQSLTSALAKAV